MLQQILVLLDLKTTKKTQKKNNNSTERTSCISRVLTSQRIVTFEVKARQDPGGGGVHARCGGTQMYESAFERNKAGLLRT